MYAAFHYLDERRYFSHTFEAMVEQLGSCQLSEVHCRRVLNLVEAESFCESLCLLGVAFGRACGSASLYVPELLRFFLDDVPERLATVYQEAFALGALVQIEAREELPSDVHTTTAEGAMRHLKVFLRNDYLTQRTWFIENCLHLLGRIGRVQHGELLDAWLAQGFPSLNSSNACEAYRASIHRAIGFIHSGEAQRE